jgi:oligopeptide/dipeptide ABC transporter ATP-binding protein
MSELTTLPDLVIKDLTVSYKTGLGVLTAVDRVSLEIESGKTLGLVGESGCGKSSLGRTIVGLQRADSGSMHLGEQDLGQLVNGASKRERRAVQMIFQDPLSALDPRQRIGRALSTPLSVHGIGTRATRREQVEEALADVGLPAASAGRLPHELSGGQRQRVNIARALILEPALVVCDEPVSALDVSLQAQVLNLLSDLQRRHGMAYLFISHDLAVIGHLADSIAVMYLGAIVERLPRESLWNGALHPYTQLLIDSVPRASRSASRNAAKQRATVTDGDLPSAYSIPGGCRFRSRCPHAMPRCSTEAPELSARAPGHAVACHLYADAGMGSIQTLHGPLGAAPPEPLNLAFDGHA